MCGIVGIWNFSTSDSGIDQKVTRMRDKLIHRGPDGGATWVNLDQTLCLGHRRLAIIDLSAAGNQPKERNHLVITFNGEIYNYIEIRNELIAKGLPFSTNTDTEVILAAYDYWGIDCLSKFDGMFAFAIYDRKKEELFIARDRFGEKPLYYSYFDNQLFFASEIKAITEIIGNQELNPEIAYNYLSLNLVENPLDQCQTFFKKIYKLKSSHFLLIKRNLPSLNQIKYWDISLSSNNMSFDECVEQFKFLFSQSVERRLRSDVPIATSLSGGLDSSYVVSEVSKKVNQVTTISARFNDFSKDEGSYIKLINERFNTKHYDVFISSEELTKEFENLVYHQDEPTLTGSTLAQYLVYKKAREVGSIVMLDGQGADELLAGYRKDYQFYARELLGTKELSFFKTHLDGNIQLDDLNLSLKQTLKVKAPIFNTIYTQLKSAQYHTSVGNSIIDQLGKFKSPFKEFNSLKEMLKYELTNQGVEKLLKFADRNSMANSIEVRLPFLSHELVEFIMSCNSKHFLKDGWSKSILRHASENALPKQITWRKDKIGFESPDSVLLNTPDIINQVAYYKNELIKAGYIQNSFTNKWKILMLGKILKL